MKSLLPSVLLFAWGCGPPCTTPKDSAPHEVCLPPDAGVPAAGAPFVLMGTTTLVGASCAVFVDGGRLELLIAGTACRGGTGFSKPPIAAPVRCEISALPEGSYVVNSLTPLSFTLPDASIPSCL